MGINIAAYAEGIGYDLDSQKVEIIAQAGWSTIILALFHPHEDGSICYNNTPIVSKGKYTGNSDWPAYIAALKQKGTIKTISASIGGGGVGDFKNIKNIYNSNNKSFTDTQLQINFQTLRNTIPAIDVIDMDCEDLYDEESFVAFCQMLIQMGFQITFCPYTWIDFWVDSLAALESSNPGSVLYWNLQCYDGGTGNNPLDWAEAIHRKIPEFNTNGFITAGDWTNDSPAAVALLLSRFRGQQCVGGAFLWTLDDIYPNEMASYIAAIQKALS